MADEKEKKDVQKRKWLLTINNPLEKGFSHDEIKIQLEKFKKLVYWCMSDETGEKGTFHTHVYICSSNGILFSTVQKRFAGAHIDIVNGTSAENRDYVFKIGKWAESEKAETNHLETHEEFGECPVEEQGKRTDIEILVEMIQGGMTNAQIMLENPRYANYLDRMDRIRQTFLEEEHKDRRRELEIVYIFGDTRSGKTRYVMDKYGYSNVYRVTDYEHPFDGYKGQDVLVFEEFRSDLRIGAMLNYLDNYPCELPSRYNNKIAMYTKVYIISNADLKDQYKRVQNEQPETFKAFTARIHELHHYTDGEILKYNTADYMALDEWKHFRTTAEIEEILNIRYLQDYQQKKEISLSDADPLGKIPMQK